MQAMIESAATYTQSIYKCKGCPPQNQSTVLQFFIRSQLMWGGHSCPPPLILVLMSEKTAWPGGSAHLFNATAACNLLQLQGIHFQAARKERRDQQNPENNVKAADRSASPDTTIPSR